MPAGLRASQPSPLILPDMKIAQELFPGKNLLNSGGCTQRLFRLSEPIEANTYGEKVQAWTVVVSSVGAMHMGPICNVHIRETYIFEATEDGEIKRFTELMGSVSGDVLSAEKVLGDLGYTMGAVASKEEQEQEEKERKIKEDIEEMSKLWSML